MSAQTKDEKYLRSEEISFNDLGYLTNINPKKFAQSVSNCVKNKQGTSNLFRYYDEFTTSQDDIHRAYVSKNQNSFTKGKKHYYKPAKAAYFFMAVINCVSSNWFERIFHIEDNTDLLYEYNLNTKKIKEFIEIKQRFCNDEDSNYSKLYATLLSIFNDNAKKSKVNDQDLLNIFIMCACIFNYITPDNNPINVEVNSTFAYQILTTKNKDADNEILPYLLEGTNFETLTNTNENFSFNLYDVGFNVIKNYIDFILTHHKESPIIKFGDDATKYNTPFFGRKDELNQIKEYFDHGAHIVIISNSTGGVGKTALAEKFVSTSTNYKIKSKVFMRFNDYNQLVDPQCTTRWLAINNRLNIQFSVDTQNRINQLVSYQKMHGVSEPEANDSAITGILKEWDEKAILIIDNANNFDTGLLHDLNKILPNVKIIITTRQQNIKESNGVKILNLSDLDYENNYKVFCNYYTDKGIASSNEPYIKQIIDIFKNNTTAIISVAKHLKANNIKVENFNAIREKLLSYSDNGDNVIKDGAQKSRIIARDLANLFRITELDYSTNCDVFDRMRPILSIMMLVQQEQIIVKDLANMLPKNNNINNILSEMSVYGFIETSSSDIQDDTIIRMHPIIALAFELYRDRNDKPLEISPETRTCVAHHFLTKWKTLPDDLDTILRILSLAEEIEEDITLPFPNSLTVSKNSTTLLDKDIDTSNIIYCYDDNNIQYKFKFIKYSNNSIILKPLDKIQDMDENSYLICNYDSSNRSISFQQPCITN